NSVPRRSHCSVNGVPKASKFTGNSRSKPPAQNSIPTSPYAAQCYEVAYTERMTDNELLDIYSDYLISAFGLTTATGLSALLEGQISHDRIQRFLASEQRTSNDLWTLVKPHIRAIQQADGVLIVDDSIAEKPYTDENDIIC